MAVMWPWQRLSRKTKWKKTTTPKQNKEVGRIISVKGNSNPQTHRRRCSLRWPRAESWFCKWPLKYEWYCTIFLWVSLKISMNWSIKKLLFSSHRTHPVCIQESRACLCNVPSSACVSALPLYLYAFYFLFFCTWTFLLCVNKKGNEKASFDESRDRLSELCLQLWELIHTAVKHTHGDAHTEVVRDKESKRWNNLPL